MIAGMFTFIGEQYANLMEKYGDMAESERAAKKLKKMRDIIMKVGYDGNWFLRAYDYYGKKVGSAQ